MSSPSRAMPLVTATLTHAERLVWWSATKMASATATPPLYSSRSSVPDSCCHPAGLTGSWAAGEPAATACSTPVRSCCMVADPASAAW